MVSGRVVFELMWDVGCGMSGSQKCGSKTFFFLPNHETAQTPHFSEKKMLTEAFRGAHATSHIPHPQTDNSVLLSGAMVACGMWHVGWWGLEARGEVFSFDHAMKPLSPLRKKILGGTPWEGSSHIPHTPSGFTRNGKLPNWGEPWITLLAISWAMGEPWICH